MRDTKKRLEYLRKQIQNENISYEEIVELQSLAKFIDENDVELLEVAGVPEGAKKYSVSVDRTPFYVEVEAKDEDGAKEKVQELLEQGKCTKEEDATYYKVGIDIEEILQKQDLCDNCGRGNDIWRNSSDERQCDNCGYSEGD